MVAAAAFDCTEEERETPDGGCLPLRILRGEVKKQDDLYGAVVRGVSQAASSAAQARLAAHEARDYSKEARDAALKASSYCQSIDSKLFGPVNETIAKYSSPPPPDFGDVGEDSKVQDWATIYKRAKSAEKEREDLQKGKQDSDRELKAAKAKFYIALAGFLVLLTVVGTAIARMKGLLP